MSIIDEDAYLTDLASEIYENLIHELSQNSAWKTIALYMTERTPHAFQKSWLRSLDRFPNSRESADSVLQALQKIKFRVKNLCNILRDHKLFDALYLLYGPEDLVIEQLYPCSNGRIPLELEIGKTLSITCEATGLPPPRYQWFHGNVEIADQTTSTLTLLIESPDQEGEYRCRVSQYDRDGKLFDEEYSKYALLAIKPTCVEIIKQPASSVRVMSGETLILSCIAKSHPNPQYQWYKGNEQLEEQNSSTLRIKPFQREDKGRYYCIVSNGFDDKYSEASEVNMDYPRQKASMKIALLIANSEYDNVTHLPKAESDAAVIAEQLTKIGFHVICLQNLTLTEMRIAIQIFGAALQKGAYGLFYFVGHGFELHGRYLMPIDAPETFLRSNTIAEDELLYLIYQNDPALNEKDPALLVVILDMCLMVPPTSNKKLYSQVPKVWEYHCSSDPIRVYSTCSYNPSYEPKDGENGIYVSTLSKHIARNIPVGELFTEVAECVRESVKGKMLAQKPMITIVPNTLCMYLTDAVDYKDSECVSYLEDLITFKEKTINVTFFNGEVSGQVTIQPLKSPYLNAIRLTTSGLENWEVSFDNSPNEQVKLFHIGTECHIFNPQRMIASRTKGSLVIQIGKNGVPYASKRFQYMKHVPQILRALRQ